MVSLYPLPQRSNATRVCCPFAGEQVNFDLHFGISQEHCMKKLFFASAMAVASLSLVSMPALRAQDASQITIQDPAEFNAYQNAITQTDPGQKAAALEGFLQTYPQSVVKKAVLDQLIDSYYQSNQPAKTIDAAGRLLQVDPNNMKAIYISVNLKKQQCSSTLDASGVATDAPTCDDAAVLAQKGLTAPKPAP